MLQKSRLGGSWGALGGHPGSKTGSDSKNHQKHLCFFIILLSDCVDFLSDPLGQKESKLLHQDSSSLRTEYEPVIAFLDSFEIKFCVEHISQQRTLAALLETCNGKATERNLGGTLKYVFQKWRAKIHTSNFVCNT